MTGAGKIGQKSLNLVSALKIDVGACTYCTKLIGAAAPVTPLLTRALHGKLIMSDKANKKMWDDKKSLPQLIAQQP